MSVLIRSTGSADRGSLVNAERACAAVRGLRQPCEAISSHCDSASVKGTSTSAVALRGVLGPARGGSPGKEPVTCQCLSRSRASFGLNSG